MQYISMGMRVRNSEELTSYTLQKYIPYNEKSVSLGKGTEQKEKQDDERKKLEITSKIYDLVQYDEEKSNSLVAQLNRELLIISIYLKKLIRLFLPLRNYIKAKIIDIDLSICIRFILNQKILADLLKFVEMQFKQV